MKRIHLIIAYGDDGPICESAFTSREKRDRRLSVMQEVEPPGDGFSGWSWDSVILNEHASDCEDY